MNVDRLIKKASHRFTSHRTLGKLASNSYPDVRIAVAKNLSTPLNILEKLAWDSLPQVRAGVANNPNISDEIAWQLCADNFVDVNLNLAENSKTLPLGVLEILLSNAAGWTQGAAAKNPGFPAERLKELAYHKEWFVKLGVIENPNVTLDVLAVLAFDNLTHVAKFTRDNVNNMPEEVFKTKLAQIHQEQLYSLPRAWVLKVLAGMND